MDTFQLYGSNHHGFATLTAPSSTKSPALTNISKVTFNHSRIGEGLVLWDQIEGIVQGQHIPPDVAMQVLKGTQITNQTHLRYRKVVSPTPSSELKKSPPALSLFLPQQLS